MPALRNRPWPGQTLRRPAAPVSPTSGLFGAAAALLRPLAFAAGVAAAGAALPAVAHADSPTDSITTALTGAGSNGSLSDALAGIGRSICPSLVKPGATLASITSQVAGTKGLSPGMAGLVTSMAIQMECPGVMTSLANGNMPFPVQGLVGSGLPSLPGAGPGLPSLPGAGLGPNALGGLGR